ncbi:MAG: hypothetical protein R3F43_23530 [bacterium]
MATRLHERQQRCDQGFCIANRCENVRCRLPEHCPQEQTCNA